MTTPPPPPPRRHHTTGHGHHDPAQPPATYADTTPPNPTEPGPSPGAVPVPAVTWSVPGTDQQQLLPVVRPDAPVGSRYPPGRRVHAPQLPASWQPATPAPRSARMRTRRRAVRATTIAVLSVVLVLVVAVAVWVQVTAGPSPRQQVEDLFAALTAGDARTTLVLTGRCDRNPLCGAGALRSGYQAPQQVHIDDDPPTPADSPADRLIAVTYTIAGDRHRTEIGFTQDRGLFGGPWTMTHPPGGHLHLSNPARFPTTLAAVTAPLTFPDPTEPVTVWAPPGVYTVTTPATPLFEPIQAAVTVTGGSDPPPLSLTPRLRTTTQDTVTGQIRDRIDDCAAQPSLTPDPDRSALRPGSCPFEHHSRFTIIEQPRWTIDRYPTIELRVADTGTVTVTTITPGTATISYRWSRDVVDPRDWTPFQASTEFTVGGRVTDEHGSPVWTP